MNDLLSDSHVCIVLSYAPAGLGHLRVTRALYEGLPHESQPILLPDTAFSIQSLHRMSSTNQFGKHLMEWSQYGIAEEVVTEFYRKILQTDAKRLEETLLQVLKQRINLPTTLLIIATHFGIAHQAAMIKDHLAKKAHVKIRLVVQVTDDSPQKMWYIPNADLIFVPSVQTKKALEEYGKREGLVASPIKEIPYPVSPSLSRQLPREAWESKIHQANARNERMIHVALPISGAAVGLSFASSLMTTLHHKIPRIHFHIIGKRTLFTQLSLAAFERRSYCTVYQSHSDRQIVELYEQAYEQCVMLAEITKPSEQAFKAILTPKSRGGVILLFTDPVGRQEYDNLNFLRRHHLIPTVEENTQLYDVSKKNEAYLPLKLISKLPFWRGLTLPPSHQEAAHFIYWLHKHQVFSNMIHHHKHVESSEVSDTGVIQFWKTVEELL